MIRVAMSAAGASLIRALLARADVSRDAVRLVSYRATDWHSLTFAGERHELTVRIPGEDRIAIVRRLIGGLGEHEFNLPGHIVADIGATERVTFEREDAIEVAVEALTIAC